MKITEITTYSVHANQKRNFNFVRVDTDDGVHGVGELFCVGADVAVLEMVKYVSQWVVGLDPLDREKIQKRILNYSRFNGGAVLYTAASAIDLALWDIAGKIAGLPVYKLLRRDLSRIYFVYQNAMNRVKNKTSLFHCKKHLERSGSKCFFLLCLAMPHPADPLTLPSP